MFRLRILSFLLLLFLFFPTETFGQVPDLIFDDNLEKGIISVNYDLNKNAKRKVRIVKGNTKYTYDLGAYNIFPLQMGKGLYTISVLEKVEGTIYKIVEEKKLDFKPKDKNEVFLQSIQIINWNKDMKAVKKAKELTQNSKNDMEKIIVIYDYITRSIDYDYSKTDDIGISYIPHIDEILESSKGICYDYAVLFASMLRSIGIPTKLVEGYRMGIDKYHAWNEVYLKDTDEWLIIDTCYDSPFVKKGKPVSMIKNGNQYFTERQY